MLVGHNSCRRDRELQKEPRNCFNATPQRCSCPYLVGMGLLAQLIKYMVHRQRFWNIRCMKHKMAPHHYIKDLKVKVVDLLVVAFPYFTVFSPLPSFSASLLSISFLLPFLISSLTSVRACPRRFIPLHVSLLCASALSAGNPMPQIRSRGLASTRVVPLVSNSCFLSSMFWVNCRIGGH